MDIVTIAAEWWVKWAFGIAAAAIVAAFRYLYKRQKALETGLQSLLRDRIVSSYYHYQERGSITMHGLESVEAMYEAYHQLGGNGMVTKLMTAMRDMEVVDE